MVEAQVTWVDGLLFVGQTSSGKAIIIDGRKEVGGSELGPTPMELVLIALAGCTAMDVISILKKQRQKVTSFQVKVRAERAEEHPKVYTEFHIEYIVKGRGISEEGLKRAIQLSREKYCSVGAMLEKAAPIQTSYTIIDESEAA